MIVVIVLVLLAVAAVTAVLVWDFAVCLAVRLQLAEALEGFGAELGAARKTLCFGVDVHMVPARAPG